MQPERPDVQATPQTTQPVPETVAPPAGQDAEVTHLAETLAHPGGAGEALPPSLPGYEILERLGEGGMGVVYKARQLSLKRVVALKMILGGARARPEERQRLRAEAEAAARLAHPNIVQVYEVGECGGLPYLALEYAEGGSLAQALAGTPLPPRRAAELVQALAGAVQFAHERGIVHRDLKPGNVLLQTAPSGRGLAGTPKVADFGLARCLDQAGASDPERRTPTGAILGTPSYMAPEQASGHTAGVGPACDVYALGALLYECLTGRPPFKAASLLETLEQVRSQEPVPPARLQAKLPPDLQTICLACLEKDPARRYASAGALADDLGRFLRGEPIHARPVSRWEQVRKW